MVKRKSSPCEQVARGRLRAAVLLLAGFALGSGMISACTLTRNSEEGGETHFLVECESNAVCVAIDPEMRCKGGYCRMPGDGGLDTAIANGAGQGTGNQDAQTPSNPDPRTLMSPVPHNDEGPDTQEPEDSGADPNPPDDLPDVAELPINPDECSSDDDCGVCQVCGPDTDAGPRECIPGTAGMPCTADADSCTADQCQGTPLQCVHKPILSCYAFSYCDNDALPRTDGVASSNLQEAWNAIDASPTATRWESIHGVDPQWIYVDLGFDAHVSRVVIDWESASAENYVIQVALDGTCAGNGTGCLSTNTPWTTIYTSPTETVQNRTDDVAVDGVGRYVRMLGSSRMTNYGYSIFDIAIYGSPNLPTSNVVASSVTSGNVAVNAIDRNSGTRWESTHAVDPQWIYVDLGHNRRVDEVRLNWETASAANYDIQIAPDGTCFGSGAGCLMTDTPWVTLATVINAGHFDHRLDNTSVDGVGRYVRVRGNTRTGDYGYSLWDFSIIGTDEACPCGSSTTLQPEAAGTTCSGCTKNSDYIGNYTAPNDYVLFPNVDMTGVDQLQVRMGAINGGSQIEARLDSPTAGTLLGTLTPTSTGGWTTYSTFTLDIGDNWGGATTRDLYLRAAVAPSAGGDVGNIDYVSTHDTVCVSNDGGL